MSPHSSLTGAFALAFLPVGVIGPRCVRSLPTHSLSREGLSPGIWLIPSCSLKSVSLPLVLGVVVAVPGCEILCHRISFVWVEQPDERFMKLNLTVLFRP